MKLSKIYSTLLTFLLLGNVIFAQSSERTLVKSFNAENVTELILDLSGPVSIKEREGDLLRIQMKVSLENGHDRLLKSMVAARRFNLESTNKNGQMVISTPSLDKKITIGGKEIIEVVRYTIQVPKNISVKIPNEVTDVNMADKK